MTVRYFVLVDQGNNVQAAASGPIEPTMRGTTAIEVTEQQYGEVRRLRGCYLHNGNVVPRPTMPSPYHEWDGQNKVWVLNRDNQIAGETEEVRGRRDRLLLDSDWTDTLSFKNRVGEAKYNEWWAYRQALRDIPQQAGFPLDVVWPVPPA